MFAAGGQYLLYERILKPALAEPEAGRQRRRLLRWLLATGSWQALTVLAAVLYFFALRGQFRGLAWIAPPIGLLLGSLLPLQLAAGRLGRAGLRF